MKKVFVYFFVVILIISLIIQPSIASATTSSQATESTMPGVLDSQVRLDGLEPEIPNAQIIGELTIPDWDLAKENRYENLLVDLNLPEEVRSTLLLQYESVEAREFVLPTDEQLAQTEAAVNAFDCNAITDVPKGECQVLLKLYNDTNGAGWTNNDNWLTTSTVGNWYGITVTTGFVSEISLQDNLLTGSIPAELGNLNSLLALHLGGNQLSGSIPPSLGNLTKLRSLGLHRNQLSGTIPLELAKLSELTGIYLWSNKLSGEIPPQIGNLIKLEAIAFGGNNLTGPIPTDFGKLTKLRSLQMQGNQLSGTLPASLSNLPLSFLYLNYNRLAGTIPSEFQLLTNLEVLELSNNSITGNIPSFLGLLTNLRKISLGNNYFFGSIPSLLGSLNYLESLDLTNNQLSGNIPDTLGSLSNLNSLYLGSNQLSGPIPPELGSLTNLQFLALYSNQLSGMIPSELGNLTTLSGLSLSDNQFSGFIPAEFGDFTQLAFLSLDSNQFSGSIPESIGYLTNLKDLKLNDNLLTGDVPASMTNLVNLCEPGNMGPPCYGYYELNLGYNHLNVPASEPPAAFLDIKDPDWYLTQAVEEDIPGATGGTLVSNDGNTEVTVPAGVAAETLSILFAPQPNPSQGTGGLNFAGKSFELTASVGETLVTTFDPPLTLTLHYDPDLLGQISEDSLKLFYWNTDQSTWYDAVTTCEGGEYTRNLTENWLSLPVCHLSEFALMSLPRFDIFLPMIKR